MTAEHSAPTLVVMAAGIGSRYGGLKQIDPVGPTGEIVIDYSVYDAIQAGFGRVVFIIRRQIEDSFREVVDRGIGRQIACDYVFQEITDIPDGFSVPADRTKPWGTAHAVYACREAVREPFAVINADDFYGRASYEILAQRLRAMDPAGQRHVLVGFIMRNTLSEHGHVSRGVCRVSDGMLEEVVERLKIEKVGTGARYLDGDAWHPLTGDETVSMNMWGFAPTIFDHIAGEFPQFLTAAEGQAKAEFLVPTLVDQLVQSGRIEVEVPQSSERWLGVTYPEDKPLVQAGVGEFIARGRYPEDLWGDG